MRSISRWRPGDVLTLTFLGRRTPRAASATETSRRSSPTTARSSTPATFRRSVTTRASRLDDPRRRREEKLGPLEEMAPRGEPVHSRINLFTANSDWITYHTVVSTSGDQIAIAPGYLLSEPGSRTAATSTNTAWGAPTSLDFFAYLSGRYTTRKEVYSGPHGPVNLEVYYDPAHTYDIDDMLASSRARSGLLSGALQPVPIHAIPHHGVPALPHLRAVVSQHRALLRRRSVSSNACSTKTTWI